ncbi:unnamed protein product [Rhizophagus irregularis]|uniref:Uncharacterized protein n=1 Tax=Rhizophagus irregularis TaxID=588596 RepID=A0A2N1MZ38_9GLOM|nr:hypothetical protein RhiirC2_714514 [Rhizophagus irregularis]CAB4389616.1 unnamed protein product [Rhizophagus irregularis]CAB5371128.1 unnamed protein product [Rhizophagus irregularis]
MKSICLVDRVKWKFAGNMNPHAFDFGDVDNDKDNEFVIGNLKGELSVFKGISSANDGQPYVTCSGLGTITCVAVGDIKNSGKNSIVCINAEGQCHIFDLLSSNESAPTTHDENIPTSSKKSNDAQTTAMRPLIIEGPKVIEQPTLTLSVPVNCNRILIADIDDDGINEIILARTDRVLQVFNFQIPSPPIDSTASIKASLIEEQPYLEEKKKWYFDGQITSLSTAKDPTTSSSLLIIGQPGGHFIIIEKNDKEISSPTQVSGDQSGEEFTEVSTEIVKGTKFKNGKCVDVLALITMDGKFTLYDLQNSSMSHHELQGTHKLFGMASIDLCINDESLDKKILNDSEKSKKYNNVFVVCAWNGCTYVIDHDFNVVKFEFEGRVCAFAAGQYAITPGHNVNCFLYVDFEDQITVYYNLRINTKPVTNFMEIMRDQFDKFDELLKDRVQDYDQEKAALSNGSFQSTSHIAEFFHQCLYQLDDYKNMKAKLIEEVEELKGKKHEEKKPNETRDNSELVEENRSLESDQKKESDTEQPEPRNNQNKHDDYVLISGKQDIVQDVETQELEGNKVIRNVQDVETQELEGNKVIRNVLSEMNSGVGEGNGVIQNQTTNTDKQQLYSESAHEIQSSVNVDNSTNEIPSIQEFDEE